MAFLDRRRRRQGRRDLGRGPADLGHDRVRGAVHHLRVLVGLRVGAEEDPELGYPVKHGQATLYFSTSDIKKLYKDLANRGAKVLRGPLTTHWGAKVMTVKAGDAVVAFVDNKKKAKGKK